MDALLVLVSMTGAWWLSWRTTSKISRLRDWSKWGRLVTCACIASLALFSAFCISGGLLLPDPTNAGPALVTAGLLLLVPLALGLWRASVSSLPPINTSNTDIALHQEEAVTGPAETAPQPVVSSFDAPPLPREFIFTYTDHEGQSSRRRVRVMGIASNDGRQYLDGYCLDRNAVRTFRVDRIQGDLTDIETGELLNVYRLLASTENRRHMDYTPAKPEFSWSQVGEEFDDAEPPTTVLFTGFAKARKEELEAAAQASGWKVRSTVSKSLDYLVCGPKAGPAKVSKAEELGVMVIDEDMFEAMTT